MHVIELSRESEADNPVVGPMDLAWICPFHDPVNGQTHVYRLEEVFTKLLEGRRAGLALHTMSRFAGRADSYLRKNYQAVVEGAGRPSLRRLAERAYLWMARHDSMSYGLLGDPAVRLVDRPSR